MKLLKKLIVAGAFLHVGCFISSLAADEQPREQIGEALGKPVYRDQIRPGDDWKLRSELHRLFTAPVLEQYREQHKEAITPTEKEILAAFRHFRKQHEERIKEEKAELKQRLNVVEQRLMSADVAEEEKKKLEIEHATLNAKLTPPGLDFARWHLAQWKLQHHLYQEFGGGRLLFQQAGVEAFDAMHRWLKQHEERGDFRIDDPQLKKAFYHYWTEMKHGAFLSDPQKSPDIAENFLNPPWRSEIDAAAALQE